MRPPLELETPGSGTLNGSSTRIRAGTCGGSSSDSPAPVAPPKPRSAGRQKGLACKPSKPGAEANRASAGDLGSLI